jgi:TonB family protein
LVGLVISLTAAQEPVAKTPESPMLATNRSAMPMVKTAAVPNAETTTIKGTVRSSKTKELLTGAAVILVGTTTGTMTDANGAFTLKEVPLNSKLAISYVGYENRMVEVTKKNQTLNVVLEWRQTTLDKIVVVTYQSIMEYRPGTIADSTKNKEVFTVIEQLPEFPGGIQELYRYLGKNIRYLTEASQNGVEGSVEITFTISEHGRIRNPRVTKSLGAGTDEEALRVVLSMPSWKPAMQHGRPVPTDYVLPIEFQIDKPAPKEDKEKRQGAVNGAKFYNFNTSFDVGTPESIRNFGSPTVTMPATNYNKVRFMNFYSREKISKIISKDSIRGFLSSKISSQNPL